MYVPFHLILTIPTEYKLPEGAGIFVLFADIFQAPKSVLQTRQALSKYLTAKSHLVKQVLLSPL